MPRTVIFSKIASVILDKQKSEDDLTEDFLSIMKTTEITKIGQKLDRKCQEIKLINQMIFILFQILIILSIVLSING